MPEPSTALQTIRELHQRLGRRRWLIERDWWGNILYYLKIHWIVYDTNSRRWRNRKLSPAVPTPITNLFRSTIDTVKSAIAQHQPRFIGIPARDDPRAVASAAAADVQLDIIFREGNLRGARRRMMDWLLLTGNAFLETSFDESPATGTEVVPFEFCPACNAVHNPMDLVAEVSGCPTCGSPYLHESTDRFAVVPRGQIRFTTLSPFEVYLDAGIEEVEDQPFLVVAQNFAREQVAQTWDLDVDDVPQDMEALGGALHLQESTLATPGVGGPYALQSVSDLQDRCTVYRAFIKKTKEFPDGAYLAVTGSGKVLERTVPYPWVRLVQGAKTGTKFYPLTHFRFGTVPGRAWGFTPADDLVPKQYQLNKAESLFTMIMGRMANPVWLIPIGTNPTRITGEMGLQVEYTSLGGQKPERVPGAEAPMSLVRYITDIRQSFDELSGAFAAVRGKSLGSRTPVGTVELLSDRGFGRWATVFENLEEAYDRLAKVSLEVWRQYAHTPRVRGVKNVVGGWTFQEFLASDWDDGVEINVESGSSRPHTQQQKLQAYMVLGRAGLLDFTDESQKVKILEDLGFSNLLPGVEEDLKHAYQENQRFLGWATQLQQLLVDQRLGLDPQAGSAIQALVRVFPLRAVPLVDANEVHFLAHRRLCLTETFRSLTDVVQQFMFFHMNLHKQGWMESKFYHQAMTQNPALDRQAATVQTNTERLPKASEGIGYAG